jgi:hypothetical protein
LIRNRFGVRLLRMVIIQFEDAATEKKALGWVPGRFSFKTWANGEMMIHENVLPFLAREGIHFKVKGPASYERILPAVRTPDSVAV